MQKVDQESDDKAFLRDREPSGDWDRDWTHGKQLADEAVAHAKRMDMPGFVSRALHGADLSSPIVLGFLWRLAERAMDSPPPTQAANPQ